jgi:predicted PurR-regulated permease PerM
MANSEFGVRGADGVTLENPETSEPRTGLAVTRTGIGLLLVGTTLLVLQSFIVPISWAAIVAFMTWGLYARTSQLLGRPRLTAFLFTLAVFLVFGVPAALMLVATAEQGAKLLRAVQEWIATGAPFPGWLTELNWIGPRIESLRSHGIPGMEQIGPHLAQVGAGLSQGLLAMGAGVARNVFEFAMTLVTLYVLYVEGERVCEFARRLFVYIFPNRAPVLLEQIGARVRAVVIGVVGTALIQGTLAGIGYALFSVPYPIALGALTALMSFVPGGTFFVWGGATVYLFAIGEKALSLGMLLWGAILVGSIDNFLRPILISRSGSEHIPFLLVLFGVLGGLASFGLLGLLLGPVVLSITYTLLLELVRAGNPPVSGKTQN